MLFVDVGVVVFLLFFPALVAAGVGTPAWSLCSYGIVVAITLLPFSHLFCLGSQYCLPSGLPRAASPRSHWANNRRKNCTDRRQT